MLHNIKKVYVGIYLWITVGEDIRLVQMPAYFIMTEMYNMKHAGAPEKLHMYIQSCSLLWIWPQSLSFKPQGVLCVPVKLAQQLYVQGQHQSGEMRCGECGEVTRAL